MLPLRKEGTLQNRSRDPRPADEKDADHRAFAEKAGRSVEEVRALEAALREVPMERLLAELYGPDHGAFYDEGEDLWIVPDRRHHGPGFGFIAIRSDRSWFAGVVKPEAFQ